MRNVLIVKLSLVPKKLFIYKMVLFVLRIQEKFRDDVGVDGQGFKEQRNPA